MNFALAVIAGIEPKDELETMLAMQMVAICLAAVERRFAPSFPAFVSTPAKKFFHYHLPDRGL
ncbi:MAG: hypothetical protein RBT36_06115 [Desulfobulbus sp.]|nr:hypothetical protein [Desulfobulbus sp.]